MAKKRKTLLDLQDILGEELDNIRKDDLTPEERQCANERAALTMNIGKQMINNADMMLRYEKLKAQNGALVNSQLAGIIGY